MTQSDEVAHTAELNSTEMLAILERRDQDLGTRCYDAIAINVLAAESAYERSEKASHSTATNLRGTEGWPTLDHIFPQTDGSVVAVQVMGDALVAWELRRNGAEELPNCGVYIYNYPAWVAEYRADTTSPVVGKRISDLRGVGAQSSGFFYPNGRGWITREGVLPVDIGTVDADAAWRDLRMSEIYIRPSGVVATGFQPETQKKFVQMLSRLDKLGA